MLNQRVNTDDDFQIHFSGADWTGKALIPRFAVRIHEDLREPNFDVVVTFLVVPVATRLFVGGRSNRLLRLSIDDGLLTCQNGLASRSVVDLRPMDGFFFRQRESFVHTVMSRYVSELICRTFQMWESTPLWRRMYVWVHLKSFRISGSRSLPARATWKMSMD